MAKATLEERFWSKVAKSEGCWNWQGGKFRSGYGSFRMEGSAGLAHRAAYILTYGGIPDGKIVLHHCDNRACCRPDHLYAGTYSDNQRDTIARTPGQRERLLAYRQLQVGERHHQARLTASQVLEIRASAGRNQYDLAREYGVGQATISDILHRRTWRHI